MRNICVRIFDHKVTILLYRHFVVVRTLVVSKFYSDYKLLQIIAHRLMSVNK